MASRLRRAMPTHALCIIQVTTGLADRLPGMRGSNKPPQYFRRHVAPAEHDRHCLALVPWRIFEI
jgi:hypothetical protein